ncbi:Uncharacterised protein [BD1-7 clade bacterium]|uniref:Uncharacterized protein n=1 Tax=BD1-7 clade bacterium TaxID=2029982 RepID=A0A5S9P811_9GAMM|nr:Uncharacterised protein [BD1-7 clade bacterium]CAA0099647.1 Uncharacterised protein [BD1-7 clade bacterium]
MMKIERVDEYSKLQGEANHEHTDLTLAVAIECKRRLSQRGNDAQ